MSISFSQIPNNLRTPFVAMEFNSSAAVAGPATLAYRALLVAQKLAAAPGVVDTAVRITSSDQALALAGRGSMAHREAIAWFANNTNTEVWLALLADNPAGAAATCTITVTTFAVLTGTIALYLGGERITVGVAAGSGASAIASAINDAINAAADLPVTSTVLANVVTVTFRHKGTVGNVYDVRTNFRDGDATPVGVTLAITAMSGGTANPSLTNLIAAIGDVWFQIVAHPYTDATSLTAIEAEMAARAAPLRAQDGLAITSTSGVFSALTTLGTGRNSERSVIIAQPGAAPLTPPFEFAAAVAGQVALAASNDPARPFQTLPLNRVMPTALTDQWSTDERNQLLFAGIATSRLNAVGNGSELERLITTYRLAPSGAVDESYLDATTVLTLLYLRFTLRTRFATKYPRHKLAGDDVKPGPGQPVMTPALGKAEVLGWYAQLVELALVEDLDVFKSTLVVERNASNPNRLDILARPNLVNQLVGVAVENMFIV